MWEKEDCVQHYARQQESQLEHPEATLRPSDKKQSVKQSFTAVLKCRMLDTQQGKFTDKHEKEISGFRSSAADN